MGARLSNGVFVPHLGTFAPHFAPQPFRKTFLLSLVSEKRTEVYT
jgi:hypothetical protein